jgi:hypothetical protein
MNRNLRESLAGGRNIPAISQFRRGNNNNSNNISQNGFSRDSDENLDLFSKIRRSFPLASSDELPDGSFQIHFFAFCGNRLLVLASMNYNFYIYVFIWGSSNLLVRNTVVRFRDENDVHSLNFSGLIFVRTVFVS